MPALNQKTEMNEIEVARIFAEGMARCEEIPAFDVVAMTEAIERLRSASRHQSGAGVFCGNLLAGCLGKVEIDLSEVCRLDLENSAAAVAVFNGLAYHCGETRNLIEDLDE